MKGIEWNLFLKRAKRIKRGKSKWSKRKNSRLIPRRPSNQRSTLLNQRRVYRKKKKTVISGRSCTVRQRSTGAWNSTEKSMPSSGPRIQTLTPSSLRSLATNGQASSSLLTHSLKCRNEAIKRSYRLSIASKRQSKSLQRRSRRTLRC